jgi:hypothetical protein
VVDLHMEVNDSTDGTVAARPDGSHVGAGDFTCGSLTGASVDPSCRPDSFRTFRVGVPPFLVSRVVSFEIGLAPFLMILAIFLSISWVRITLFMYISVKIWISFVLFYFTIFDALLVLFSVNYAVVSKFLTVFFVPSRLIRSVLVRIVFCPICRSFSVGSYVRWISRSDPMSRLSVVTSTNLARPIDNTTRRDMSSRTWFAGKVSTETEGCGLLLRNRFHQLSLLTGIASPNGNYAVA